MCNLEINVFRESEKPDVLSNNLELILSEICPSFPLSIFFMWQPYWKIPHVYSMIAGHVLVGVMELCFGLWTDLIQYSKLYFETSFNFCQIKKWFLTILDIFLHQSLLFLRMSSIPNECFSFYLELYTQLPVLVVFWFSVSFDCSTPSRNGDINTGWIFKVLYLDNHQP